MAELWFQLVLKNPGDRPLFDKVSREKAKATLLEFGRLGFVIDSKNPDLLIMAAQARLAEQDFRGAYELYSQVVRLDPNRVSAWFNMGILLMNTRQSKSATVVFRRVVSMDPNDPEAFGALGVALYRQKKLEEAEGFLREALKLRPGDPVASTTLKSLLKAKKQKPVQP
jgi:Flp pilus assembly protein TadD